MFLNRQKVSACGAIVVLAALMSACASSPNCGDADHPYHQATEGKPLIAPAGSQAPEEDFSTELPQVLAEASAAEQQATQTRGCIQTPPQLVGVVVPSNASGNDGSAPAVPQNTPRAPAPNTPKAPVL